MVGPYEARDHCLPSVMDFHQQLARVTDYARKKVVQIKMRVGFLVIDYEETGSNVAKFSHLFLLPRDMDEKILVLPRKIPRTMQNPPKL